MRTTRWGAGVAIGIAALALAVAPACQKSHEEGAAGEHEHPAGTEHPGGEEHPEGAEHPEEHSGTVAVAPLASLGGSGVKGRVVFTATDGGVKVEADVTGLSPGDHGFHIHEWGDCSSADGKSAGGHFNPTGHPHAGPTDPEAHLGDLGNLTADANGHATFEMTTNKIALGSGAADVVGRSVIVHEKADDMVSQPTGAAGGRLACGVIAVEGAEATPVLAP